MLSRVLSELAREDKLRSRCEAPRPRKGDVDADPPAPDAVEGDGCGVGPRLTGLGSFCSTEETSAVDQDLGDARRRSRGPTS
jgi:hypothetical protein